MPSKLTKLGESAFYGCTSLDFIDIPASLWTIQPYTFKNCINLEYVWFQEGNLQKISDGAFYGTGLTELVLPNCLDGVVTGCILSVGRILGESAALLFTAGFAHSMNGFLEGLTSAGASLTVALYVYAKEDGEFGVAFGIAAILMVLAFCINLAASAVTKYFQKKNAV